MKIVKRHVRLVTTTMGALCLIAGCTTPSQSVRVVDRSSYKNLLKEAQNDYTYQPTETQPLPGPASEIGEFDGASATAMITSSMATPRAAAPTTKRLVVARFKLTEDYPRMGMFKGFNYIFLDQGKKNGKGAYRDSAYFVVAEGSATMHYLRADIRKDLTHGRHPAPVALMVISRGMSFMAGCVEGNMCPSGHCGLTDAGAELQ